MKIIKRITDIRCRTLIWLALGMLSYFSGNAQVLEPNSGEHVQSLNGIWKFKYLESGQLAADSAFYKVGFNVQNWPDIKVPGHWELQGFAEPSYGKTLKDGTGLYKREFTLESLPKGQPLFIAFEGVQFSYSFWINGHWVGKYSSSYNRQTFEISKFINYNGYNAIAVKVDTHPKGWEFDTNDDWSLSGIVRDIKLFTLPVAHFKDVIVKTTTGNGTSDVFVKALVENSRGHQALHKLQVIATLFDPSGNKVQDFTLRPGESPDHTDSAYYSHHLKVKSPKLWNAEAPNQYYLRLTVKNGNDVIQEYHQKFGFREVTWDHGIFKINGKAVKLRGVDHHDLSPINGRAITVKELTEDIDLVRKANINFIRTSHYPPNAKLLDICDSLGIYLMIEVPFGFGDQHLKDTSYLHLLRSRAYATVRRDKNHPSVIIWSVGNENPVTPMTVAIAQYVKRLDDTRPVTFPQRVSELESLVKKYPDSIDVYSPHYPTPDRLKDLSGKYQKPLILTEYAHSLGLDFDMLESLTDIIWKSPRLAGGAVWMFSDQGILRKAKETIKKNQFTYYAWQDSLHFYDTNGNAGADGIVYANRVPQVDYWQVRKVYSPVRILNDTLTFQQGKKGIQIRLANHYDFTNLAEVSCQWQLIGDKVVVKSGSLKLNGAPHDTVQAFIPLTLPRTLHANVLFLKVNLKDEHHHQFYEKTIVLKVNVTPSLATVFGKDNTFKPVQVGNNISGENYTFKINPGDKFWQLNDNSGRLLIKSGPYMRAGRLVTMSMRNNTAKDGKRKRLWQPDLLQPENLRSETSSHGFKSKYLFRPDSNQNAKIEGTVDYIFNDHGGIDFHYEFTPTGEGAAVEAGLSFLIPSTLSEFRWLGKGPYAGYPGKNVLNDPGLYHLNSQDLNYQGNRQNVAIALFTDDKGYGFALIPTSGDVNVERKEDGIMVSHNVIVSGRFNKFQFPEFQFNFNKVKTISGSFTIIPLSGKWPVGLIRLFGDPNIKARPFKPFYHSYDQADGR